MSGFPERDGAPRPGEASGADVSEELNRPGHSSAAPLARLESALALASRGWPILPLHSPTSGQRARCSCGDSACDSIGKHPRTAHGLKDATTDAATIRAWWALWPAANIGVRTGAESGIFAIDIDPRHDGDTSLTALEAKHAPLPDTAETVTGGGGRHLFFRHPGGPIKSRNGAIPDSPGIDCKSDGGYVVAPGSAHASGRVYAWREGRGPAQIPLADAPGWLVALLTAEPPSKQRMSGVETRVSGPIAEGRRNEELTSTAGYLRRRGMSREVIETALLAENAARCAPPLPDEEVRGIAASVAKYPPGDADEASERGPRQADILVALAEGRYRFAQSTEGEPFAALKGGQNIARMLRGSRDSLRGELAREFFKQTGKAASAGALADAMLVVEGLAGEADREPVHLRVAPMSSGIVLDLGDQTGRAVVVEPRGWRVVERSPVLFRRTELTGALPTPLAGGSLSGVRELLNMSDDCWPLALGWLVAGLIPDVATPIGLLSGDQGSGKSCAASMLSKLVDPSPAPLRTPPRDVEGWVIAASGSRIVPIDNVSAISEWWSDALCRAVTGDGLLRRRLYSDSSLSVVVVKRPVLLTSIDAGAIRGDLGDRLLLLDCLPIPDEARREEREIWAQFDAAHPSALGALLDLLSGVLRERSRVRLTGRPRMADFATVLAAMDAVTGSASLDTYMEQRARIAGEVVAGDAVAEAIVRLLGPRAEWAGTSGELLVALTDGERTPHGWPRSARALSGRVRRAKAPLAHLGIQTAETRSPDKERRRLWHLYRTVSGPTVRTVRSVRGEATVGATDCAARPLGISANDTNGAYGRGGAERSTAPDSSDTSDDQSPPPSVSELDEAIARRRAAGIPDDAPPGLIDDALWVFDRRRLRVRAPAEK